MKVVVIGTNHAGTTAVRTIKRIKPEVEVVTFDKSDNISFLGCGIALWVGGEVEDPNSLFYANAEILENEDIEVNMNHEWLALDNVSKNVVVRNLITGDTFEESYDKLIIATGSWPIISPIPGVELEGIQICKNYHHAKIIEAQNNTGEHKNIAVIGAGYIGVEIAEAFNKKGHKTTLIDLEDRIMKNYYDKEFTDDVEWRMKNSGLDLYTGERVVEFIGKDGKVVGIKTDKRTIETDFVVMSVGTKPQTDLLDNILDLNVNGSIVTDEYCQTSDSDIYAIGDCCEVYNAASDMEVEIGLATTAVRTGILAAINSITNNTMPSPGFTGANGIDVFGMKMAAAGMSAEVARKVGFEIEEKYFTDNNRPEFMSTVKKVALKVIWDKETRRILGAQVASENNHTEVMYMFALAIQKGLKIEELPLIDIFFLPHFNKPYNFITLLGLEVLGLNYFKKND